MVEGLKVEAGGMMEPGGGSVVCQEFVKLSLNTRNEGDEFS